MSLETLLVRREAPADSGAIHVLQRAAFRREAEAGLVDALRREGAVVLSLVAEEAGAIVGHILYSRLVVEPAHEGVSALAPVAVMPERQRRGIGSRLIEEAHRMLTLRGETMVFVLGDPVYYRRFGFSAARAMPFQTPYDGEYMQALPLGPDAPPFGRVHYPAAFSGVE